MHCRQAPSPSFFFERNPFSFLKKYLLTILSGSLTTRIYPMLNVFLSKGGYLLPRGTTIFLEVLDSTDTRCQGSVWTSRNRKATSAVATLKYLLENKKFMAKGRKGRGWGIFSKPITKRKHVRVYQEKLDICTQDGGWRTALTLAYCSEAGLTAGTLRLNLRTTGVMAARYTLISV